MGNSLDARTDFGDFHIDLASQAAPGSMRGIFGFALEETLADLGLGLALLDAAFKPLQFSSGYRGALARCGLSRQVPSSFAEAVAVTRRLFTADFHSRLRCGGAETVVLSGTRPVGVFRRIDHREAAGDNPRATAILVLRGCSLAREDAGSRNALLRDAYGMTEREATIALKIASGRSADAIAAELGISMNTMRTHLKRIYDKAHVAGQTELVNRILASPIGWLARPAATERAGRQAQDGPALSA